MAKKFVSTPIFVGLGETNLEGNVYWVHFFEWFGTIREQFLLTLTPNFEELFKAGLRIITAEEHLKHLAPAFFGQQVTVKIHVSEIKKVQTTLSFGIENTATGQKLAEGWQTLLFAKTDGTVPTKKDLIPIPKEFKETGLKYFIKEAKM